MLSKHGYGDMQQCFHQYMNFVIRNCLFHCSECLCFLTLSVRDNGFSPDFTRLISLRSWVVTPMHGVMSGVALVVGLYTSRPILKQSNKRGGGSIFGRNIP